MREERLTEGKGREGRAGKKGAEDDLIIYEEGGGGTRVEEGLFLGLSWEGGRWCFLLASVLCSSGCERDDTWLFWLR